ncbi:MAG: ABC transporter permease [Candidatus Hodarchaeales archaeon]
MNMKQLFKNLSLEKVVKYTFSETYLTCKLAWRNVTRSKYRSFLLILGILFTVALETGIVISVDTLYDDFLLDHRNQNYTDITVTPVTEWKNIDELRSLAKNIEKVSNVYKASPVYYISISQFLSGEQANILLFAVDSSKHPDMSSINIIDGKKKISGSEVIISEGIAQQGFSVGQYFDVADFIPPEYGIDNFYVEIAGIMSDEPSFANKVGFLFILCDIDSIVTRIPQEVQSSLLIGEVDIQVSNFLTLKYTSIEIEDLLGIQYNVFVQKSISEIEATGIRAYQTAMNLVILASFVVEFLFITNVLAIAIRDRSKEIGVLRAIGSRSRQLIQTIATEIMIYSIIGCTLGVILGMVFSNLLVELIDTQYTGIDFQEFSIRSSSIFATYLSGIIVALISGLYPIFLALTMQIVQNIHSQMRISRKSQIISNWKSLTVVGILLSLVGFSLQLFIGPSRFLDFNLLSIHFLVVLMIFFGTVLVEAGILIFLPKAGMRVLTWFDLVTRTISMRNINREFQKSLFTILTAGMALTFIIVVGLTSAAVISSVPSYFQDQWGGIDVVCQTSDFAPKSLYFADILEGTSYISKSSYIQEKRTVINNSFNTYIFGVDPLRYVSFSEPVILSESGQSPAILLSQNDTVNCLMSDLLYDKLRVPMGSNITLLTLDNRTINIKIAAIIKSNVFLGNGEYLYINSLRFQEFYNTTFARWFVCSTDADIYVTQFFLQTHFTDLNDVIVIDFYMEAIENSLKFQSFVFQILFVESFILAAIAQFVCILVSTLRMEREMGIMRSMGLTREGVLKIFMCESTALGLSALLIGSIDGLIGSILLSWYISLSIPVSLNFFTYIERVIFWVLISFVITLGSTIIPSWRSSTKNVVDTISGRPRSKKFDDIPIGDSGMVDFPFWDSSAVSFDVKKSRESELKQKYTTDSSYFGTDSFFSFVRKNRTKIQITFLVLLAITVLNYIFDPKIIVRGLNPLDIYWRMPFKFLSTIFYVNPMDYFLNINPFLFIVVLSMLGSVAYYLYHGHVPNRLIINLIKNLFYGLSGLFFMVFIFLIDFFVFLILPGVLVQELKMYYSPPALLLFSLTVFLIFIGVYFYFLQYTWVFLIYRGIYPSTSLKKQLLLTKQITSTGRFGFYALLLTHMSLQTILTFLLVKFESSEFIEFEGLLTNYSTLGLDPVAFVILSCFEVFFLLLLIIYQIRQIQKFNRISMCTRLVWKVNN